VLTKAEEQLSKSADGVELNELPRSNMRGIRREMLRVAQHDPFDKTQGHGEGNRTMTDQCHSEAESRRISLQRRSKLRGINP